MEQSHYHVVIIGAGIVGAATAREVQRQFKGYSFLLIDKESNVALHQTGRNSGVLHAGVYYAPGSLKARFCRKGAQEWYGYCDRHLIPVRQTGKLIVATNPRERGALKKLADRAQKNGLAVKPWTRDDVKEKEPNVAAVEAFEVAESGIVDYKAINHSLVETFQKAGGEVLFDTQVVSLKETPSKVLVNLTTRSSVTADYVINCAGLQADRLAHSMGLAKQLRILPFMGIYYRLPEERHDCINRLIYPVPDPTLPFLGVHLTPMISGDVTVGPNAIFSLGREWYDGGMPDWRDLAQSLSFSGFWRCINRYVAAGLIEIRSTLSKEFYLKRVQKYMPSLERDELLAWPTGIRAQAVNAKGDLIHDFSIEQTDRTLHVCNAPSPAATSALPIARHLVDKINLSGTTARMKAFAQSAESLTL